MSEAPLAKKAISAECRHVVYCPRPEGQSDDIHAIKLNVHYDDGSSEPKFIFKRNFKKKLYVTKNAKRHHKQKREKEQLAHLDEFETTNYDLVDTVASQLGMSWCQDQRKILNSPYLYGNDISTKSIIKYRYMERSKIKTYSSVAVFDIETDVINQIDTITMATLSFKDKVVTAVRSDVIKGYANAEEKLKEKLNDYLKEYIEKRKIHWELIIVDTPGQIVREVFARAHLWMPDFIAIWNMDFDLPRCIQALEKEGINPADVFSDPTLPKEYRHFKYHQGPKQMTTNMGVVKNLMPAEQWHYVDCPASFYFIDAMCTYWSIRRAAQKDPSYSLDYILQKELGIRKLKFKESDHIKANTIEWHKFMQKNYPLEYVIYNVFDCISVEELDEKTLDLSLALTQGAHCSDYSYFNSQPRRVMDQMHWFLLERGYVSGCSGDLKLDIDKLVVPLKGFIVTLPAFMIRKSPFNFFADAEGLDHSIHVDVADEDVSASYPNGMSAFNISRQTTSKELVAIEGKDYEHVVRHECINLSGGVTNAVAFVTRLYGAPDLFEIDRQYAKAHGLDKATQWHQAQQAKALATVD